MIRSVSLRGTIHIRPKFKDNWGLLEPSGVTLSCILERGFILREYYLMQPIGKTSGANFFSITLSIF